jgi:hypothetical protein
MRQRIAALAVFGLLGAIGRVSAQSSQFGIRGLGLPGREASAYSLGLGGAESIFDGQSSTNPAALGTLSTATALFTSSGDWRTSTNPAGTLSTRDTRFPQILIGGPVAHRRFALGVSYSLYTDRDFTVVSDGQASPRGVPVEVHDTLSSRGGIDDLRIGGAWVVNSRLAVGAALHFLTGSNRLVSRRFWEDTTYLSPAETAELSYSGTGVSIGALWNPVHGVQIAATFRRDGSVGIDRDSTGLGQVQFPTSSVGSVTMPTTITAGIRAAVTSRLSLVASGITRNWSVADSDIQAEGAPGARNTVGVNGGIELIRNARQPLKYPLRLGAHYTTLPFLLVSDPQPHEFGVSLGTGRRFAADRGGFDIAIERIWRSQGSGYTEGATVITVGISVRPPTIGQ